MTTIPYTVQLENVTRSWSYTSVQGTVPDRTDPVQLADGATYSWEFDGELVPAALHQLALGFSLWCHTATDVPTCDRGDEIRLRLTVGTKTLVDSPPLYVNTVEVATDLPVGLPPDGYTTQVVIRCADDTTNLPALRPQPRTLIGAWLGWGVGTPFGQQRWSRRLAEIAERVGRSLGVPSWWPTGATLATTTTPTQVDIVQPPGGTEVSAAGKLWTEDAATMLETTLNSGQPRHQHHTIVPSWAGAYPTGYQSGVFPRDTSVDPDTGLADPASSRRLLAVPASRRTPNQSWPLQLGVLDAVLTLLPAAGPASQVAHDRIGIDAAWCDLPVKVRRAREHIINTVELKGALMRSAYTAPGPQVDEVVNGSVTAGNPALGEPTNTRSVPTYRLLAQEPGSTFAPGNTPIGYGGGAYDFLWWSDASQRAAWVYDAFTMRASRVDPTLRDTVLPRLAPRIPGEPDGNGQVLKHLTIYRPAPETRFADAPQLVTGFVASGQLRIAGGDLLYTYTLTPGLPIPLDASGVDTTAATPVTVGQVDTGSYQAQQLSTIDPLILVADLAYAAA